MHDFSDGVFLGSREGEKDNNGWSRLGWRLKLYQVMYSMAQRNSDLQKGVAFGECMERRMWKGWETKRGDLEACEALSAGLLFFTFPVLPGMEKEQGGFSIGQGRRDPEGPIMRACIITTPLG